MPVQGEASGGAAGRLPDPGRPASRAVRGHSSVVNTPALRRLLRQPTLAGAACNRTSTLSFLLPAEGSRCGVGAKEMDGAGDHPRQHSRWGYSLSDPLASFQSPPSP